MVQVYLRLKYTDRLPSIYTIKDKVLCCKMPEGSSRMVHSEGKFFRNYTFTKIFDPLCTQTTIFDSVVKPRIVRFINGHSNTVLCYGVSGSGNYLHIYL